MPAAESDSELAAPSSTCRPSSGSQERRVTGRKRPAPADSAVSSETVDSLDQQLPPEERLPDECIPNYPGKYSFRGRQALDTTQTGSEPADSLDKWLYTAGRSTGKEMSRHSRKHNSKGGGQRKMRSLTYLARKLPCVEICRKEKPAEAAAEQPQAAGLAADAPGAHGAAEEGRLGQGNAGEQVSEQGAQEAAAAKEQPPAVAAADAAFQESAAGAGCQVGEEGDSGNMAERAWQGAAELHDGIAQQLTEPQNATEGSPAATSGGGCGNVPDQQSAEEAEAQKVTGQAEAKAAPNLLLSSNCSMREVDQQRQGTSADSGLMYNAWLASVVEEGSMSLDNVVLAARTAAMQLPPDNAMPLAGAGAAAMKLPPVGAPPLLGSPAVNEAHHDEGESQRSKGDSSGQDSGISALMRQIEDETAAMEVEGAAGLSSHPEQVEAANANKLNAARPSVQEQVSGAVTITSPTAAAGGTAAKKLHTAAGLSSPKQAKAVKDDNLNAKRSRTQEPARGAVPLVSATVAEQQAKKQAAVYTHAAAGVLSCGGAEIARVDHSSAERSRVQEKTGSVVALASGAAAAGKQSPAVKQGNGVVESGIANLSNGKTIMSRVQEPAGGIVAAKTAAGVDQKKASMQVHAATSLSSENCVECANVDHPDAVRSRVPEPAVAPTSAVETAWKNADTEVHAAAGLPSHMTAKSGSMNESNPDMSGEIEEIRGDVAPVSHARAALGQLPGGGRLSNEAWEYMQELQASNQYLRTQLALIQRQLTAKQRELDSIGGLILAAVRDGR